MKHTPSTLHCSRLPSWLPSKTDPLIIEAAKMRCLLPPWMSCACPWMTSNFKTWIMANLRAAKLTPERKGAIMNESKQTTPTVSQKMVQEAFLKIYRKMIRNSWAVARKLAKEDDLNNKDK